MKKNFLCLGMILLLADLATGSDNEVGKIFGIDPGKKEIILNVKSGTDLKMGEQLFIRVSGEVVVMEATFPMQTTVKCKLLKKYSNYFKLLERGMNVYKYNKTVPDNTMEGDGTAGIKGDVKSFCNIEFVYIEGGTFTMGAPENKKQFNFDEKEHNVTVSSFWIGKYEVTQKQYTEITGSNPSVFKDNNLPVESVNWYDAVEYCNKLSSRQGIKPYYKIDKKKHDPNNTNTGETLKYTVSILGGYGFRIPTEAEWEYACRAGTTTQYYWGDNLDGDYCWYDNNSDKKTHPVGQKEPNAYGVYDMIGNVWEWCWDWYGFEYYSNSPTYNPPGADSGDSRVMRGGSWYNYGVTPGSAERLSVPASFGGNYQHGFRVVRSAL